VTFVLDETNVDSPYSELLFSHPPKLGRHYAQQRTAKEQGQRRGQPPEQPEPDPEPLKVGLAKINGADSVVYHVNQRTILSLADYGRTKKADEANHLHSALEF
jgi:hypothetical protein